MAEIIPGQKFQKPAPAPKTTPMMAQYTEIKAANPDSLLFYRMGDFFELFFDDAVAASKALDIALTKRGKHNGGDIPMCGVPVRAADRYLQILIRKGFRVAVCDQTEDPAQAKKRGAKAVVRRDVTRLVTRGTLTEDALLEPRAHNFLAALGFSKASGGGTLALAWTDISTGEMFCAPSTAASLGADLARIEPGELLVPENLAASGAVPGLEQTLSQQAGVVAPLAAAQFDSVKGARRLKAIFGVAALEGFGSFSRAELGALGALVSYIELTQIGKLPALAPPRRLDPAAAMAIDPATRASLELVRTLGGERQGSLLDVIDRTVTGAGSRALADRLLAPSTALKIINQRLDAVAHLHTSGALREHLRAALKAVPDLARALSRLSLARGGPRDLGVVRDGLGAALALPDLFASFANLAPLPGDLGEPVAVLAAGPRGLQTRLGETLGQDLPFLVRDGGFVAPGHVAELDEARALRDESRRVIAAME
ncbi:MAG: DNA mismatch repair protein MutS, partial [Alphaproteobacteria bacterium]